VFGMGTGVTPPVWPPGMREAQFLIFNLKLRAAAAARQDHVYQEQMYLMLSRTAD